METCKLRIIPGYRPVRKRRMRRNRIYTNNTSIYIWKISQSIELEVAAPAQLHRGDRVSMQIRMKNKGAENLTDILVGDRFG